MIDAHPTNHDDTGPGPFRATVLQARLAACPAVVAGSILAPGKRTVASALRAVGLEEKALLPLPPGLEPCRLVESGGKPRLAGVARGGLRARRTAGCGHRRDAGAAAGKKIAAKGIYRDPVRSSHQHFVKTSALRWVCLTFLAEVPWASRVWALPFL